MFQITIVEKRTVTKRVRGKHGVIGERPVEQEDVKDVWDEAREAYKDGRMIRVHGYAPDREEEVEEEYEVLKQTVEHLDLVAVIRAINEIK